MAITHNLARLSDDLLRKCADSVAMLDSVCSFRALNSNDYLDLDWAPRLLQRVLTSAGIPDALVVAFMRGMNGEGEINPAYRDWPDSIWEHPVSWLSSEMVSDVSAALKSLSQLDVVNGQSVEDAIAGIPADELPDEPLKYLQTHFNALCRFYAGAAEGHQALLMWQD